MNDTLLLVLASVFLLFLLFILLFIFKGRTEINLKGEDAVLKYPLSTKRINLPTELESWKVQRTYYLRLGVFYTIIMRLKRGKQLMVSSRFNQSNYNQLYSHLNSHFRERRTKDE
ncbi:hypothetical protein [Nafulsella turpanensis]|uniref:hypothetical protein n=1 Tax=Nafulsella turpanensis TaxID=1265690 RepID=UPI00034AD2F0|nr:hypothetical protein [Nafulsella turpanensis]